MTYAVLVLTLGIQAAQDPPPGEKLAKELHDKALKLGPVSFKVQLQIVDAKGGKTDRYQLEIYLDLAGGEFSTRSMDLRPDEPAEKRYMTLDRFEVARIWSTSNPGTHFKMQPIWRWVHELTSDRRQLIDPSKPVLTYDEWIRSATPDFRLDCTPDPSGSEANFTFFFSRTEEGGISWLQALGKVPPGQMETSPESVVFKDASGAKTTTLDLATGFLKSIGVNLKSGEGRLLTVSEFKAGAGKPRYEPPEVRETWIRPEDMPLFSPEGYRNLLAASLQAVLDHWDRLGKDSMKAEVKAYLARLGARHDICTRFAAWRQWTGAFLDELRTRGEKLPAPEADLKLLLERLQRYIKKGEESYAEQFEDSRDKFGELLAGLVASSQGAEEAKSVLTTRVRQSMDAKLVEAARSQLKMPELEELLRETLRKDLPVK